MCSYYSIIFLLIKTSIKGSLVVVKFWFLKDSVIEDVPNGWEEGKLLVIIFFLFGIIFEWQFIVFESSLNLNGDGGEESSEIFFFE